MSCGKPREPRPTQVRHSVAAGLTGPVLALLLAACSASSPAASDKSATTALATPATAAATTEDRSGRPKLIIFLEPDVTAVQQRLVRERVLALPDAVRVEYQSQEGALQEAQCLFKKDPESTFGTMVASEMPASFRVELGEATGRQSRAVDDTELERMPGVKRVIRGPDSPRPSGCEVPADRIK